MTTAPSSGQGQPGWTELDPRAVDRANDPNYQGLESRSDGGEFGASGGIEGLLPSVYFAFDQATIGPKDRPSLQTAADYLASNPSARLIIEGHCDWRGTSEYNMALGERRAASAREYLVSLGVDAARLETVSMGDLEATQSDDESILQEDRRADLIVLP